jgi:hypothetical protein
MKKKAYKKPAMAVYDFQYQKPLLTTSDPFDPSSIPGWEFDFS